MQLLVDILKLFFDLKIIEPLDLRYKIKKLKRNSLVFKSNTYENSSGNSKKHLNNKQVKLIKRRLRAMLFTLKKDIYGYKTISGSKFMVVLSPYFSLDSSAKLIKYWKNCKYLSYEEATLESQSAIKILREDDLIESVNSFKS